MYALPRRAEVARNYVFNSQCLQMRPTNIYLSLVECKLEQLNCCPTAIPFDLRRSTGNDNEEEMDYLTGWDQLLPRFHNQEDYGEVRRRRRS